MCGLFGVIQHEKQRITALTGFMEDFTRMGVLRGKDSTGFFQVRDTDDVDVFKLPYPGEIVAETTRAKVMFNMADTHDITIGHHRAATRGGIKLQNCHPFEHWDSQKYLVGAHNGFIEGWKGVQDKIAFEVDSDWALYNIFKSGGKAALETFKGAYAFIWYENDGKLRVAVNGQRELHFAFVAERNAMLIGSEHAMLWAAAHRNRLKIEPILYPNVDTIYTFDPADVRAYTSEKYELAKPAYNYKPPGTAHYHEKPYRDPWAGYHSREVDQDEVLARAEAERARAMVPSPKKHDGEDIIYEPEPVRNRLKIPMGEFVEFFPDYKKILLDKEDSTVLYGEIFLTDDDTVPAIMYGVEKNIRANILGADRKKALVECRLIGVTRTAGLDGKKIETAVVSIPQRIIDVGDDAEPETVLDKENTVPGPDNLLITPAEFSKLARDGCGYCTGAVTINEAMKGELGWSGSNTGPVTPYHLNCLIQATGGG